MSLELLYTSATAGLRQGSRGFCTVLSTTGMPINLASRLETLSGYRHVYSPQDANADDNPVCHSHLRIKVAGKWSSVLSRVSAYGVDYSGRTNKLAHHIVVEAHEHSSAGPAWVLNHGSIIREQWDGKNHTPPSGPAIPPHNKTAQICNTWASVAGDAGWGGRAAEAFRGPSAKPHWIIFDLNQSESLLTLLSESIALLPESERWSATFSTYYTNLPPEIDCRVRCVLSGTDEARLASARGSVIDLTTRKPLEADSPLIQMARSGSDAFDVRPSLPKPVPSSETMAVGTREMIDNLPSEDGKDSYELRPPKRRHPLAHANATRPAIGPPARKTRKRNHIPLTIFAGLILFALTLASGSYVVTKIGFMDNTVSGMHLNRSAVEQDAEQRSEEAARNEEIDDWSEQLNHIERQLTTLNAEVQTLSCQTQAYESVPAIEVPIEKLIEVENAAEALLAINQYEQLTEDELKQVLQSTPDCHGHEKSFTSLVGIPSSPGAKTLHHRNQLIATNERRQKTNREQRVEFYKSLEKKESEVARFKTKLLNFERESSLTTNDSELPARLTRLNKLQETICLTLEEKRTLFPQFDLVDDDFSATLSDAKNETTRVDEAINKASLINERRKTIRELIGNKSEFRAIREDEDRTIFVVISTIVRDGRIKLTISGQKSRALIDLSEATSYYWEDRSKDKRQMPWNAADGQPARIESPFPSDFSVSINLKEQKLIIRYKLQIGNTEGTTSRKSNATQIFRKNCQELMKSVRIVVSAKTNMKPIEKVAVPPGKPPRELKDITAMNEVIDETTKLISGDANTWQVMALDNLADLEKQLQKLRDIDTVKRRPWNPELSTAKAGLEHFVEELQKIRKLYETVSTPTEIGTHQITFVRTKDAFSLVTLDQVVLNMRVQFLRDAKVKP